MLLTPEYIFAGVSHITPEFLAEKGITALALDVDNTLTSHDSQELPPQVDAWLSAMHAAGVRMFIVSNNEQERVAPFAQSLGLEFVAKAAKPLPGGMKRLQEHFKVEKEKLALVGDQLFTDRLCGALYGVPVFVVEPMAPEIKWFIKLKRVLEKPFIRRYYRKGGQLL